VRLPQFLATNFRLGAVGSDDAKASFFGESKANLTKPHGRMQCKAGGTMKGNSFANAFLCFCLVVACSQGIQAQQDEWAVFLASRVEIQASL
jgi:hypothetical protein